MLFLSLIFGIVFLKAIFPFHFWRKAQCVVKIFLKAENNIFHSLFSNLTSISCKYSVVAMKHFISCLRFDWLDLPQLNCDVRKNKRNERRTIMCKPEKICSAVSCSDNLLREDRQGSWVACRVSQCPLWSSVSEWPHHPGPLQERCCNERGL